MKLTDIVQMDGNSAIDWIIEHQHDFVLVPVADETLIRKMSKSNAPQEIIDLVSDHFEELLA